MTETTTGPAGTTSDTNGANHPKLDDASFLIGGQGGDGTLTVSELLARYYHGQGLNIYTSRSVLSRIRGGYAAAATRVSVKPMVAQKSTQDVIVAFHQDAITFGLKELAEGGIVLADDKVVKAEGDHTYLLPLSLTAASKVGSPLYKNTLSFGALSVLLGMDRELAKSMVEKRFGKRGAESSAKNLTAFDLGIELATQQVGNKAVLSLEKGTATDQILTTGNQGCAMGFIVGGGRFFAGYPITPATPILETLQRYLPQFGGVVRQAEDELSAINMTLGAAYAGARAMTATSGPGFSLMTEALGHAGEAEIPVVIVDSQRVGPSTGEPTRNEQSDLLHSVFASHGEFPRLVLAPGFAKDAFDITINALNLAEKWQLPVILLLDQALSENTQSSPRYDLTAAKVERGNLLTQAALDKMESYKRYELTPNGISPRTIPGMKGGQSQVTGNEHDEWGHVSVNVENRKMMMAKRMMRLRTTKDDLPQPHIWSSHDRARVGFIGFGSTYGPIREAQALLEKQGVSTRFYQARTLWPVQIDTLAAFMESVRAAFVVEHNYMGQFSMLIREYINPKNMEGILKYDGNSFRGPELVQHVMATIERRNYYEPNKVPTVLPEGEGGGF